MLILIFSLLNLAASANDTVLSQYVLDNPSRSTLEAVKPFFEAEHKTGNSFELVVSEEEEPLLLALAPTAKLVLRDTAAAARARVQSFSLRPLGGEHYHSLSEVQAWMKETAARYPEIASTINYGKSAAGNPLTALRLTSGQGAKPVLMITAATHGDELITTEVLMALVDQLVVSFGYVDRLSELLKRHDIYFVPVLNPDGFSHTNRYDGPSDPNRSYPYPGHSDARPTPSIAGIIHLFEMIHPVGSIDFHAFGGLIMYPWAYTHAPVETGAREKFNAITSRMAETNHYTYGPISDVIYVAPGSSADYYFWKSGSLSLGIELGDEKIPDPSQIPSYIESQSESTWRFIEAF